MRNRTIAAWILTILVAVGAGLYLAPTHEEMALMKMKDDHFHDALQHYTTLLEQGDHSINVTAPLIKLYVHYGDMDKAIALVKTFLTAHPHSVAGHKWLAKLYKFSQRFYAYCAELETLQDMAPDAANLRELADTYDFLGEYKKEMQALGRLVVSRGYVPQEEDYVKLASFYRIDQQPDKAIEAILAFVVFKQYAVQPDTMQLAVHLLLEKGDAQQAFSLASAYLQKSPVEKNAVTLASLFRLQGKLDDAYALLTPFLGNLDHSPNLMEEFVAVELAQGKSKDIYNLLCKQFARGVLAESMTPALIDLAIKYNDTSVWETLLQTVPLQALPEDALLRYADVVLQNNRPDLAQDMKKELGDDYLRDAPVLSAILDCIGNDSARSIAALLAVPADSLVLPEQKMIVADIYFHHGYPQRAMTLFEGMSIADMLDVLDTVEVAQLYLNAHEENKLSRWLAATRPHSPPVLQQRIDKTALFLAAGEGNTGVVQQWLKDHPVQDSTLLSDAYDLSNRYHRPEVALVFAQHAYSDNPSLPNRLQWAEALTLNHRYAEAMETLAPLTDRNHDARGMYIDAMADWIRQAGKDAHTDEKFDTFLATALNHDDLSPQEKRDLAYLLEDAGFRDKAGDLFFSLAYNQPYGSQDVTELLNFWGEHPSAQAVSWMEARARDAYGPEQAQWLQRLNATGHPQSVLAVVRTAEGAPPAVADEYIEALALSHNSQLDPALHKAIGQESNPIRLKHLATIAEEENLDDASEQGWRRLHAVDPQDSTAVKELGLLAFDDAHYTEAKPLLEQYMASHKTDADYRVNYAYAEILQHLGEKSQAQGYFSRAENQVAEIQGKDVGALLDQAHLLYRNNHLEQALDLYRSLLARYPKNKAVRADFAEVLIETKQFAEASLILAP